MFSSLVEIGNHHLKQIKKESDFEMNDYKIFNHMIEKFKKVDSLYVKPYLATIHMNMWFPFHDFTYDVMEYLGYEEVGRMELPFEEQLQYNFEADDVTYDCLFRLKNVNADYTSTFKL